MKKLTQMCAALLAVFLIVAVTGCPSPASGGGGGPVTGVTLNKTAASVELGFSITLTPTVAPASATNKAVTWSSSDTTVATVANGTVTGLALGTATITVTTVDGSKTATCLVTVEKSKLFASTVSYTIASFAELENSNTLETNFAYGGWEQTSDITLTTVENENRYATVTFNTSNTWAGGAVLQRAEQATEMYDFTNVVKAKFQIRSSDLTADELRFEMQPGRIPQNSLSHYAPTLVISDEWADVEIDVSGFGEKTVGPVVFGFVLAPPKASSFDIRAIDFVDAAGESVNIAENITYTWPLTASKTAVTIAKNGTETVTVNKGPRHSITNATWTSNATAVATVVNGVITGVAEGTATITASTGSETVAINVTVVPNSLPPTPTKNSTDVISLLNSSATYTNITVGNWSPKWWDQQLSSITDVVVNTKTIKLLNLQDTVGINIASQDGNAVYNVGDKTKLHLDYYTPDGTKLRIKIITSSANDFKTFSVIANTWGSVDYDFASIENSSEIKQIVFQSDTDGLDGAKGVFLLDNIYFYK